MSDFPCSTLFTASSKAFSLLSSWERNDVKIAFTVLVQLPASCWSVYLTSAFLLSPLSTSKQHATTSPTVSANASLYFSQATSIRRTSWFGLLCFSKAHNAHMVTLQLSQKHSIVFLEHSLQMLPSDAVRAEAVGTDCKISMIWRISKFVGILSTPPDGRVYFWRQIGHLISLSAKSSAVALGRLVIQSSTHFLQKVCKHGSVLGISYVSKQTEHFSRFKAATAIIHALCSQGQHTHVNSLVLTWMIDNDPWLGGRNIHHTIQLHIKAKLFLWCKVFWHLCKAIKSAVLFIVTTLLPCVGNSSSESTRGNGKHVHWLSVSVSIP